MTGSAYSHVEEFGDDLRVSSWGTGPPSKPSCRSGVLRRRHREDRDAANCGPGHPPGERRRQRQCNGHPSIWPCRIMEPTPRSEWVILLARRCGPGSTHGPASATSPFGMHRQGYDLQLTQYDERGWRATFYTTGMEHSPTSATGSAWEPTPWRATNRAAWEALRRAGDGDE
jgi:hypothetical protein